MLPFRWAGACRAQWRVGFSLVLTFSGAPIVKALSARAFSSTGSRMGTMASPFWPAPWPQVRRPLSFVSLSRFTLHLAATLAPTRARGVCVGAICSPLIFWRTGMTGAILSVAIMATQDVSGAHLNPMVTIVLKLLGISKLTCLQSFGTALAMNLEWGGGCISPAPHPRSRLHCCPDRWWHCGRHLRPRHVWH
jgi:hypothetical protein